MESLFLKVAETAFSAGWVVLAVLGLRLLLKKAPRWILCGLWALVALRLLLPVLPESPLSLTPEPVFFSQAMDQPVQAEPAPLSPSNTPVLTEAPEQWSPVTAASLVWLAGMAGMLCWGGASFLRLRKKVAPSLDLGNGVFLCDYIDSPFILGIFRPKIYLPSTVDPRDAKYILAHERCHLARKDHWWKPAGFLLLAVNWFQPLLWLAYVLLSRDIESACDEKVVKDFPRHQRACYSEALLRCSVPRSAVRLCPLAFGEIGVKERVKNVMSPRRPTFWILLLSLAAVILTSLFFLTRPQSPSLMDLTPDYESASIWTGRGIFSMDSQSAAMKKFLRETRYDPAPVPGLDSNTRQGWSLYFLTEGQEPDSYFYISQDCQTLSCYEQNQLTTAYTLKDPEAVREFLDYWSGVVMAQKSDRSPYWVEDQPWIWAQEVTVDDIAAAFYPNTPQNADYFVFRRKLQPVVESLNRMKKSDFTPVDSFQENLLDLTYPANETNTALYLYDTVNGMVEVIHLCQGRLELLTTPELQSVMDSERNEVTWTRWELHGPDLARAMDGILEGVQKNTHFTGWRFNWQGVEFVHGDIRITSQILEDWVWETVPYTDDRTPCGIRCRPPEATEGWMFLSFWPAGTQPEEEIIYRGPASETEAGAYYTVFDSDTPWIKTYTRAIQDTFPFYG